jgi:hypothetical protein
MKTITKKYIRKRKTMKKRIRKNRYLLKGGYAGGAGGKGPEEEKKDAAGKGPEEGDKPGDVVVDSEGNKWTFKDDPVLGPVYYSFWTLRGEPVYIWTADKLAFLKGDFKKKAIEFFMSVNPTAIMMKTAMDTGLTLLEENKDKIQNLKNLFMSPMPNMPNMPNMPPMSGMFGMSKIPTAISAVAAAGGGRKRKQRKFTKRLK